MKAPMKFHEAVVLALLVGLAVEIDMAMLPSDQPADAHSVTLGEPLPADLVHSVEEMVGDEEAAQEKAKREAARIHGRNEEDLRHITAAVAAPSTAARDTAQRMADTAARRASKTALDAKETVDDLGELAEGQKLEKDTLVVHDGHGSDSAAAEEAEAVAKEIGSLPVPDTIPVAQEETEKSLLEATMKDVDAKAVAPRIKSLLTDECLAARPADGGGFHFTMKKCPDQDACRHDERKVTVDWNTGMGIERKQVTVRPCFSLASEFDSVPGAQCHEWFKLGSAYLDLGEGEAAVFKASQDDIFRAHAEHYIGNECVKRLEASLSLSAGQGTAEMQLAVKAPMTKHMSCTKTSSHEHTCRVQKSSGGHSHTCYCVADSGVQVKVNCRDWKKGTGAAKELCDARFLDENSGSVRTGLVTALQNKLKTYLAFI